MSSANPLTSRFLAFRAARKLRNNPSDKQIIDVAVLAVLTTQDEKDANFRASMLVKERATAMDDSTANTDEISSKVSRFESRDDVAPVSGFSSIAGDYMLTPAERAQLRREWQPKARVAQTVIDVQVSTDEGDEPLPADFVPAPVEPYVGFIDKTVDAWARAYAEFELTIEREASKLLLMS